MEKLFRLVFVLSTCAAVTQDLSGKVFVFPQETDTDHVKLLTPKANFTAFTACMRYFTDLTRSYSLLSLATLKNSNSLLIYRKSNGDFYISTMSHYSTYRLAPLTTNTWHSVCVTWQSDNGLAQLWLDGKPSYKKYISAGITIPGCPNTILGQEQDSNGGGFSKCQSFTGMISDFHMWDDVLSPIEIQRYMNRKHFTAGNVFNWRSLKYEITGRAFVDDNPDNLPW